MRRIIADTINSELRTHGFNHRVDHRTLREQGIVREPVRYVGAAQFREMRENRRESARDWERYAEGGASWMSSESWRI